MHASSKLRRSYEKYVVRILLDLAVEDGYKISVDNYSTTTISRSIDVAAIMACMFSNNEECLLLRKENDRNTYKVYLVYGRDNIISDYSSSIGSIIDLVHKLSNDINVRLDERTIGTETLRW